LLFSSFYRGNLWLASFSRRARQENCKQEIRVLRIHIRVAKRDRAGVERAAFCAESGRFAHKPAIFCRSCVISAKDIAFLGKAHKAVL
jgi:hypothetical protein